MAMRAAIAAHNPRLARAARIEGNREFQQLVERVQQLLDVYEPRVNNGEFFPEQLQARENIIRLFRRIQYCLLRADTQSGKSGVYHSLIQRMFELEMIDRAYIICGSHETELRNQCIRDVEEYHANKPYQHLIKVIFRQDFNKHTSRMITRRSLIIVDETHLVMERGQTLNRFLKKHSLSMMGETPFMKENQIYMLSVDATPYAEEAAMTYKDSFPKGRVVLENGDGYYGPQHYYRDELVQPTYTLWTEAGKEQFTQLLRSIPNKFALIRVQKLRSNEYAHVMECIRRAGANMVHYTSDKTGGTQELALTTEENTEFEARYHHSLPCLEVQPANTTVVIVDGRLRCGKRVAKEHIGFVWETSSKAKTDTIIQSLLGRMCGYDVPEDKPRIFIPGRLLKHEVHGVVSESDLMRSFRKDVNPKDKDQMMILPRYASHIMPGHVAKRAMRNGTEVFQCAPIRFMLDDRAIELIDPRDRRESLEQCFNKLKDDMIPLILLNSNLTRDQKTEIRNWLDDDNNSHNDCYVRNFSERTNEGYHKSVVEGYKNGTAASEHTSDHGFLTFCITHEDCNPSTETNPVHGQIYAIFYTRARGHDRVINKPSRVGMHSGRTHFSIPGVSGPAGSAYGFSPEGMCDAKLFEKELDAFISYGLKGVGIFGRRFVAFHTECIELPANAFGLHLERLTRISANFARKGIVIRYEKRQADTVHGKHLLNYIEWDMM
jgi:hypothetical protein